MPLARGALFALLVPPLVRSLHLASDEAEERAAGGVDDVTQCPLWCGASKQYWPVKCTYSRCSACSACGPSEHSRELQGLLAADPEAEPQGLLGGRAAEAEPQGLLGGRAAEAGAIAEVATERANESGTGVAGEGVEDSDKCPIWCHVSKQYWRVKCTYSNCANCPMCGPPASKAAPEAEPQGLLGGRAAEAGAIAEVATHRANESGTVVAGEGVEDSAQCPIWCHFSKQYWYVKCAYSNCANCSMCGAERRNQSGTGVAGEGVEDSKEAAPEAEPQGLLGGRAAEADAIAEVATERANESGTGVAGEGVEDSDKCPIWCHVSKQYWRVKCTYTRCSTCPMCGPPASKNVLEAEPQGLLGGRTAEVRAIAEVTTQLANESGTVVVGEGVEDMNPQCPLWCQVSKQSWQTKCTYTRCSICRMCGTSGG